MGAMRKIRLPRSLKLPTCRMTDIASMTKTPPTRTSSTSCFVQMAMAPSTAPMRERAGVAHEHAGGMAVVPEETEARADEGGDEDGQFGELRVVRDAQVMGNRLGAGGVGEEARRCRRW